MLEEYLIYLRVILILIAASLTMKIVITVAASITESVKHRSGFHLSVCLSVISIFFQTENVLFIN